MDSPTSNDITIGLLKEFKAETTTTGFLGSIILDAPLEFSEEQRAWILSCIIESTAYESDFLYGLIIHFLDMYQGLDAEGRGLIEIDELIVRALEYQGLKFGTI